jgi:hypothetical protein
MTRKKRRSGRGVLEIVGELNHEGHESYSLDVVGRRMVSGDGVWVLVPGAEGVRCWRGDGH